MVGCSIIGCKSRIERNEPNVTFHRFPQEPVIMNKWIECTGRINWKPTRNSRICGKHFTPDCFPNVDVRFLRPNSVPSLFIRVPFDPKIRNEWMTAINRMDSISPKTKPHCCEDHFDVPVPKCKQGNTVTNVSSPQNTICDDVNVKNEEVVLYDYSTDSVEDYPVNKTRKKRAEILCCKLCAENSEFTTCRLCLSEPGRVDLKAFSKGQMTLAHMLYECYGITLSCMSDVGRSHLACTECAENVELAIGFKQQVLRAERVFKEHCREGHVDFTPCVSDHPYAKHDACATREKAKVRRRYKNKKLLTIRKKKPAKNVAEKKPASYILQPASSMHKGLQKCKPRKKTSLNKSTPKKQDAIKRDYTKNIVDYKTTHGYLDNVLVKIEPLASSTIENVLNKHNIVVKTHYSKNVNDKTINDDNVSVKTEPLDSSATENMVNKHFVVVKPHYSNNVVDDNTANDNIIVKNEPLDSSTTENVVNKHIVVVKPHYENNLVDNYTTDNRDIDYDELLLRIKPPNAPPTENMLNKYNVGTKRPRDESSEINQASKSKIIREENTTITYDGKKIYISNFGSSDSGRNDTRSFTQNDVSNSASRNDASNSGIRNEAGNSGTINYSSNSGTRNYASNSGTINYASNSGTKKYASNSGTINYASNSGTINYASNSGTINYASNSGTINYASNSGTINYASNSGTRNYASNSGTKNVTNFFNVTKNTSDVRTDNEYILPNDFKMQTNAMCFLPDDPLSETRVIKEEFSIDIEDEFEKYIPVSMIERTNRKDD